jgi:hypothetical protein
MQLLTPPAGEVSLAVRSARRGPAGHMPHETAPGLTSTNDTRMGATRLH